MQISKQFLKFCKVQCAPYPIIYKNNIKHNAKGLVESDLALMSNIEINILKTEVGRSKMTRMQKLLEILTTEIKNIDNFYTTAKNNS